MYTLVLLSVLVQSQSQERYWINLTNKPEQVYGRIVNGYATDITERRAIQAQVQRTTQVKVVTQVQADAYGFTAWLNATRASYGLPGVAYDQALSNWAAVNNSHQASRGMGHYVMGSARRQNSAMGHYASIGAMWMASPGHRSALLDPSIRTIGLAGLGSYWTFNAR